MLVAVYLLLVFSYAGNLVKQYYRPEPLFLPFYLVSIGYIVLMLVLTEQFGFVVDPENRKWWTSSWIGLTLLAIPVAIKIMWFLYCISRPARPSATNS